MKKSPKIVRQNFKIMDKRKVALRLYLKQPYPERQLSLIWEIGDIYRCYRRSTSVLRILFSIKLQLLIWGYFSWGSQKLTKNIKKVKNQPKKDNFEVPPQGVDQLLHVDQLWGVDKYTFFYSFSDVLCWFQTLNHWKRFEMNKIGWKMAEKNVSTSF